jgi:hypothetical protein
MLRLVPFRPLFRSVNRFFCSAQNTAPQATINFPEHNVNVEPQGTDMETDGEEEEVRNLLTSLYCIYLCLRFVGRFSLQEHIVYGLEDELVPTAMDEFGRIYGTGRRKTSQARVWIKEGSGQFIINGRRITDYFQPLPRDYAMSPLVISHTAGFFDVWCTVKGGGTSGTMDCSVLE